MAYMCPMEPSVLFYIFNYFEISAQVRRGIRFLILVISWLGVRRGVNQWQRLVLGNADIVGKPEHTSERMETGNQGKDEQRLLHSCLWESGFPGV